MIDQNRAIPADQIKLSLRFMAARYLTDFKHQSGQLKIMGRCHIGGADNIRQPNFLICGKHT
jgi:hypothetical protein